MYRDNVARDRKGRGLRIPIVGRLIDPLWRIIGRIWSVRQPGLIGGGPVIGPLEDQVGIQRGLQAGRESIQGLPGAEISEDERRRAAEQLQDHHQPG